MSKFISPAKYLKTFYGNGDKCFVWQEKLKIRDAKKN
jgi:hypothetical protein